MPGIKMIQPQACSCHLIEHGCLEVWMAVVTGLGPAMVITHQEDDIWFFCSHHRERGKDNQKEKKAHGPSKSFHHQNRKREDGKVIFCRSVLEPNQVEEKADKGGSSGHRRVAARFRSERPYP